MSTLFIRHLAYKEKSDSGKETAFAIFELRVCGFGITEGGSSSVVVVFLIFTASSS